MRRGRPEFGITGMILFGTGFLFGLEGANMLHRAIVTYDPKADASKITFPGQDKPGLPAGVDSIATYNDLIVDAPPNWKSMAAQAGLVVAGFLGGALIPWSGLKLVFYGVGFGALGHLGLQVIDAWVIEPMFADSDTGKQWYAHELKAKNTLNPKTDTKKTAGGGDPPATTSIAGTPVAAAAPAILSLPMAQAARVIPPALASFDANAGLASLGTMVPRTFTTAPPLVKDPSMPPPQAPPSRDQGPPPSNNVPPPSGTMTPPQVPPQPPREPGNGNGGNGNGCGCPPSYAGDPPGAPPPQSSGIHPIMRHLLAGPRRYAAA